jgi:glycosyltransferase involved in cell wall biosynthesis
MREPLVIGVGRLTRQKGFDLLIDAFAGLQERFPQWRMVILGTGPEQAALQSQIDRHSLQARVSLQGFDSDIESWFARAGLVVQPSRFEGFPNVLLEAMGMGAAVISSDCPAGPSEIIQDGINGRLVPMEDVSALGAAKEAHMRDAGARERLGEAAKAVRERFHVDLIMADWDRALFPSIAQESLST